MRRELALVVRADDAAGSIAANLAITEALGAGIVRNVSVMGCARQDCWDDWVSRFFALPDTLRAQTDIGLHVTLNAEWKTGSVRFGPCLGPDQVPFLVEPETGFFTASPHTLSQQGWGQEQVHQAVREVQAQLRRLRDAHLTPVYLDEHMGVGWLPGLRAALVDFARSEGLIATETLNLSRLQVPATASFADALLEAVESFASPALLVLHPARDSTETALFWNDDLPPGQVARERERERRAICDSSLAGRIGERNVRLLRYSDIASL